MARRISVEIVGDSSSLERSFRRSSTAAHGFERDVSRAGRGVAAVSLGFAGLGRSIAFASSAFIGAAGLTAGVHAAISGAENLAKAQDSVRTVLGRTGESVQQLLPLYQQTSKAAAQFGISQADALTGLAKATTLTGNAASAFRAYEEAIVISKATHISFDSALTATSKAQEGITTSLRRYGILVDKSTSGTKQFQIVMSRFGGQARANTSDLDRLRANLANLSAQLGGPLLSAAEGAARGLSDAVSRISKFADRVGAQTTVRGKLNVIWTGVEGATVGLVSALRSAIAGVDWSQVWAGARGIADGLQKKLEQVNWSGVGAGIANGLRGAIEKAIPAAKDIGKRLSDAVASINVVDIGKKLGPGLAAAVVTAFATLTDPSFWLHNWQLALSVGLVAFGGSVGRIAGKLAEPLVRVFGRLGEEAALRLAGGFARLSDRLGGLVLSALLRLPSLAVRAVRPLTEAISGVFGRLGRITRFTLKVIGVDAAIRTVSRAVAHLARLIGHGLDAAWHGMEVGALKAALAIVEPFSHLPGFLGGGPFQRMKAALQAQLDGMDKAAKKTADSIAASMSVASQSVAEIAAGRAGQVADRAGPSAPAPSKATPKLRDLITQQTKNATNLATSTVAKGFVLPFRLQLAQARAGATAAAADDIKVAQEIRAFILKAIPHLHGQKLIDAYNQLGAVNQTIAGAVKQAAKIGKDFAVPIQLQVADAKAQALGASETGLLRQMRAAAERALRSGRLSAQGQISAWNEIATVNQQLKDAAQNLAQKGRDFTEPIKLQIAEARAQALGISDTRILEKMKRAAQKALASGKLSAQGQIDAWNEIASINQQIASSAKSALGQFKALNTRRLTAGLGLTPEERALLRARLSQIGPGGTVPGQGVGAAGFAIATDGRPIVIHSNLYVDGERMARNTTKHQQKRKRRNPGQRRGPNAGG